MENLSYYLKAYIAKTKQILGEEAVVTDSLGNIWRSKVGESSWIAELSEQSKLGLALLNETTGGFKGAAHQAFEHYRTVPYGAEKREALNIVKWQFKAMEKELRAAGTTFKGFYGPHVTGKLGNELIHFKGKSHLLAATIKRTVKTNGITEQITGLHWDFGKKLEQLGVYSLSKVEHLAGGMYEATLNYGGVIKKGKTFFPSNWDAKMLTSKISEACHNAHSIQRRWDGTIEIKGIIEEGFQIIVKLNKKGRFLTSYPKLIDIL